MGSTGTFGRWKLIIAAASLGFGGICMLVALWVGATLLTRQAVNEAVPVAAAGQVTGNAPQAGGSQSAGSAKVVRSGQWKGVDAVHRAAGSAQIIETAPGKFVLRVEQFSVTNGPDLFVVLSPKADGYTDGSLNLGKLKGTDGAFNYEIPAGTDLSKYKSAVVWCKAFNFTFGTAALSAA